MNGMTRNGVKCRSRISVALGGIYHASMYIGPCLFSGLCYRGVSHSVATWGSSKGKRVPGMGGSAT